MSRKTMLTELNPTLSSPERTLAFRDLFSLAGSTWSVSTNAPEILYVFRQLVQSASFECEPDLSVSIHVNVDSPSLPPWPEPYFRGHDHLVYAAYNEETSFLIDLLHRRVIATMSLGMAEDLEYWKRVLIPVLLGVASISLQITPLHCACLVHDGFGLLLGGQSGAGKSTLSLALALEGFAFLSDDWTYFSRSCAEVHAWGLPTPLKLLPDAVRHFPELHAATVAPSLNAELAYEVDPAQMFGVRRTFFCEPRWLVFVERLENSSAEFQRISQADAASRLEVDLETQPAVLARQREYQLETIRTLVQRECWLLRHDKDPSSIAHALANFCRDGDFRL